MDKLKMQTKNNTQQNIEKLKKLFPNAITEKKDENNKLQYAINFDLLKQELSEDLIADQEFYDFNWVGKKASIIEANKPIRKTLRPAPEESKDWKNTKNLYIEGDNLDVLKLLQESYLNKVKMIYIDPPYNTGKDFLYKDDWKVSKEDYDEKINLRDDEENRLFQNNDSNGRFHSDWCSMIYPRLKLARNLLSEDGVIFISIDDNEVHNLRKICDEVFGEGNFVAEFVWNKKSGRQNDAKFVSKNHEYILCYSKNLSDTQINLLPRTDETNAEFQNYDNDNRGDWIHRPLHAKSGSESNIYTIHFPNGVKWTPPIGTYPRFSKDKLLKMYYDNRLWFGKNGMNVPRYKRFLSEVKQGIISNTLLLASEVGNTQTAKQQYKDVLPEVNFDNPKPVGLLNYLIKIGSQRDDIILDFFSGSATTAHAVMQLNAEDGENRRFIMVQLPEKCKEDSEAFKAGFKTISDIGKERIRRAGDKIRGEIKGQNVDTGFRVFKLDSTNMKDVYYSPVRTKQQMIYGLEDNIKEDRTDTDLLYGVIIDWGVELDKNHSIENMEGKRVHFYDHGDDLEHCALIACFEPDISENLVRQIAEKKPVRVVFRDGCFKGSADKINATEIFKIISPNTRVKVI